jgi:hypothetical protein
VVCIAKLAANTRRNRQRIVRNFCLYRQRAEPICFVPDINRFPRRCPHAPPVIFGPVEVARVLARADSLAATANSPLRPAVMRLAVVLLYTAGLRSGELLRLTLADVDRCCAGTGKAPMSSPTCPSSQSIWGTSRLSPLPITCDGSPNSPRQPGKRDYALFAAMLNTALASRRSSICAYVTYEPKRQALMQVFPEILAPPRAGYVASATVNIIDWLKRL